MAPPMTPTTIPAFDLCEPSVTEAAEKRINVSLVKSPFKRKKFGILKKR